MPRLSYPGGRQAAARMKEPTEELKSSSIKKMDVVGEEEQAPDVRVAPQDEASVAFQKQIDALRESERIQKERADRVTQEREDAIRRANEHQAEVHRLQKSGIETQADYLSASLAAATAEAETAQRDIEKALELGDFKGQADAYRRLSKAETSIARLEDGRAALEAQTKAAAEVKVETPKQAGLPPLIQSWLDAHPDIRDNAEKIAEINHLHFRVLKEGNNFGTRGYIESMETHLGMREQIVNEDDDEPQERRRPSMVSAPVSREAPVGSNGERPGQVRLTAAMKEAAKIAGITEKEYAENLLKLREHKANGMYTGGQ